MHRKVWVNPAAWITCNLSDRGRYELTLLLDLSVTYLAEGGMSGPCCLIFCDLAGRGRYDLTLQLELPVTYLAEGSMSWPYCLYYLWPSWQASRPISVLLNFILDPPTTTYINNQIIIYLGLFNFVQKPKLEIICFQN